MVKFAYFASKYFVVKVSTTSGQKSFLPFSFRTKHSNLKEGVRLDRDKTTTTTMAATSTTLPSSYTGRTKMDISKIRLKFTVSPLKSVV